MCLPVSRQVTYWGKWPTSDNSKRGPVRKSEAVKESISLFGACTYRVHQRGRVHPQTPWYWMEERCIHPKVSCDHLWEAICLTWIWPRWELCLAMLGLHSSVTWIRFRVPNTAFRFIVSLIISRVYLQLINRLFYYEKCELRKSSFLNESNSSWWAISMLKTSIMPRAEVICF